MLGWDLITAIVVITSLSVLAYVAGARLGRGICLNRPYLFAETLVFSLIFGWCFSGKLGWAELLPASGIVYWSNWMPVLLSFAAGLARATPGLDRWRRPFTVTALLLMAFVHLILPVGRPMIAPVQTGTRALWKGSVCLQSHESTCGAAAAATLLTMNGIPATERQMIDACLTSEHGTEPLGVFRGLNVGVRGYQSHAKIASRDPGDWVGKGELPNVALIRFDDFGPRSGSTRWLLGPRGEGHAIVVVGFEDGRWLLADPAVGLIRWSDADFRKRFTGDAIFLAGRKHSQR